MDHTERYKGFKKGEGSQGRLHGCIWDRSIRVAGIWPGGREESSWGNSQRLSGEIKPKKCFWNKQLQLEHRGFLEELNWARSLGANIGNFLKIKLKSSFYISGQWVHYILIVSVFDCPPKPFTLSKMDCWGSSIALLLFFFWPKSLDHIFQSCTVLSLKCGRSNMHHLLASKPSCTFLIYSSFHWPDKEDPGKVSRAVEMMKPPDGRAGYQKSVWNRAHLPCCPKSALSCDSIVLGHWNFGIVH